MPRRWGPRRVRRERPFQSRQRTVSRASVDTKLIPAAVESITKGASWGGQQSGTVTALNLTSQAVSVGDFIIVGVYIRGGPATGVTLGSSLGNTYTNLGGVTSGAIRSELWGGFVTVGGSEVLTFSWVTSGTASAAAALFKGLAGSSAATALDVAVISNTANGSAITSGASGLTGFPADLVISYTGQTGLGTFGSQAFSPPGTPYVVGDTEFQSSGANNNSSQLSSTSSDITGLAQSFSLTSSLSALWITFLATFRAANVVLSGYAATVATPRVVVPGVRALVLTGFVPIVATPRVVIPSTRALILTTFAPSIATPRNVVPATASLVLTRFASTVTTPRTATPSTRALILATFAPLIALPKAAIPPVRALVLSTFAPDVLISSPNVNVTPAVAVLVLTRFAPTLTVSGALPDGSVGLHEPGFYRRRAATTVQRPILVMPRTARLVLRTFAPTLSIAEGPVDMTEAYIALYASGALSDVEFAALIAA